MLIDKKYDIVQYIPQNDIYSVNNRAPIRVGVGLKQPDRVNIVRSVMRSDCCLLGTMA